MEDGGHGGGVDSPIGEDKAHPHGEKKLTLMVRKKLTLMVRNPAQTLAEHIQAKLETIEFRIK